MKLAKIGKKASEETKAKLRLLNLGKNNHFYNKKHTLESKLKQSESAKTRKITEKGETKRREGISKNNKKPKSMEHTENIRKAKLGSNNPMFGKKWKKVDGKRIYL